METQTIEAAEVPVATVARPPRTHHDSQPLPTDSMVTVSLSDTDGVSPLDEEPSTDAAESDTTIADIGEKNRPSSLEILGLGSPQGCKPLPSSSLPLRNSSAVQSNRTIASAGDSSRAVSQGSSQRTRSSSNASDSSMQVDWEGLQKTEEQEQLNEGSDEQSMALLLARLEQENNALAIDPKSIKARARSQSRPPSIHQLKKLVETQDQDEEGESAEQGQGASTVRFSLLPSPPPMTELDFWAALVKDYPQTAQRLPTLTSNKIRGGIPAPLRGIVWVSMAGAREKTIEEQFDTLVGQSSPYENLINKDVGRSFPGVEMFRDPAGEGQRMLGRVLKCFSLYDDKIGYCQGLGFLVGPLLMEVGEREAFCVLVRLMEDYDLRSCFLPDLSGLHLRIYQFQRLLTQHIPELSAHLDTLQVEAAYLSQWFLSFFAVTCPLPMLVRIYDVVFAEGASETIMRVALAVMRRNEKKLLAMSEFEDVMQLLLSRALWDPYGCHANSASELVNDFVAFSSEVTREKLQALESGFRKAQDDGTDAKNGFFPSVQTAASSFLGRLWAPAAAAPKSASLSPSVAAPSRPTSFLRKSPSKQSIASTLNSIEGSSESTSGTASTALTDVTIASRESATDSASIKSKAESMLSGVRIAVPQHDRDLHSQIEDLLTAMSEMQREHALLSAQLQREREERNDDHKAVRRLLDSLPAANQDASSREERRRTLPVSSSHEVEADVSLPPLQRLSCLIHAANTRFPSDLRHKRKSSSFETRQQLREQLARSKEQLQAESRRSASLSQQLTEQQAETASTREQLRDARQRLATSHADKQRLEKALSELKRDARKGSLASFESTSSSPTRGRSDSTETLASSAPSIAPRGNATGLRELKLGRSGSVKNTQPQFSKRTSSLATADVLATENHVPVEPEALLLELVNAKTAEAVARQELDELKGRFEAMRKMLGLTTPSPGPTFAHTKSPSTASAFELRSSSTVTPIKPDRVDTPGAAATPVSTVSSSSASSGGWFWGKRSVSAATPVVIAPTQGS